MSWYWKHLAVGVLFMLIGQIILEDQRLYWGIAMYCIGYSVFEDRNKTK